ncbi:unnamed protein product [Thelazia callipaeda]|uniref:Secreted protein n=1 Tax=Thelazia callipaeda TaxID=103827 RepID=A0A0N5CTK3_THECL|nr:unnamed protein product [Thelazia callipaeda]
MPAFGFIVCIVVFTRRAGFCVQLSAPSGGSFVRTKQLNVRLLAGDCLMDKSLRCQRFHLDGWHSVILLDSEKTLNLMKFIVKLSRYYTACFTDVAYDTREVDLEHHLFLQQKWPRRGLRWRGSVLLHFSEV